MILFIGQVARDQVEREAFQEIDYRRMFGQMAKWVVEVDDAARLPELLSQAFHRATNGRPGPVVVALPEDMLTDRVAVADAGPARRIEAAAASADLQRLQALLGEAQRPLVVLGGGGWTTAAVADARRFIQAQNLPVAASFRCQDLFDNTLPQYAGDLGLAAGPELVEAVKSSDLLLVIGARLGEMSTGGYALVDIPVPRQALVHIHPGIEELGRVYQPTLAINAGMPTIAAQLAALAPAAAGVRRVGTAPEQRLPGQLRMPAFARRGADERGDRLAQPAPGRRQHHHLRCRQLHRLGAPRLPAPGVSHLAGAHQRLDGLWRAGGDCGQAHRAAAQCGGVRR